MAEKGLEKEVVEILEHIKKGSSFLLSGGAGSGKTYSLVHVINETIRLNPRDQIACITYTNAAVREIDERINHKNLRVSTIHDFLWDNIKTFQKELKKSLLELINDDNCKIKNPNKASDSDDTYENDFEEGISYKEHIRIAKGEISHDEVLMLASFMYEKYKVLCDIMKDKYKFVFIDEYQDTSPFVVDIFLKHLSQSKKDFIVGFFGDSMQAIYGGGVGNLNEHITSEKITVDIKEVEKLQNRRNPQLVIDLANKIRTDGLEQEPSKDEEAPNMENSKVKQGDIKFLYSTSNDLEVVKKSRHFENWDFYNSKKTKELNLTHNLIAPRAGFTSLMDIYDKDPVIQLKSALVSRIKKEKIEMSEEETFAQVVEKLALENKQKELKIDVITKDPKNKLLYEQLKNLPFLVVRKIYLDKDSLIDDKKEDPEKEGKKGTKRDDLTKHLFKIQTLIYLYEQNRFSEFIWKTEYEIDSIEKKREIKRIIEEIKGMGDFTIEEVINFADAKKICLIDDRLNGFIEKNGYVFNRVKQIKFKEFQNLYFYLEGFTPFSTQHKTKGAEYDNVLVILDNGKWNNYNFARLFGEKHRSKSKSVLIRTQKIFYVCCTRAKENLTVFYHEPSDEVIEKAKEWFGEGNVVDISI